MARDLPGDKPTIEPESNTAPPRPAKASHKPGDYRGEYTPVWQNDNSSSVRDDLPHEGKGETRPN